MSDTVSFGEKALEELAQLREFGIKNPLSMEELDRCMRTLTPLSEEYYVNVVHGEGPDAVEYRACFTVLTNRGSFFGNMLSVSNLDTHRLEDLPDSMCRELCELFFGDQPYEPIPDHIDRATAELMAKIGRKPRSRKFISGEPLNP